MVEYKREYTEDIKKNIIAFGGVLYIGINDDETVYGVNNPNEVILQITNMIRDSIKPNITMFVDCRITTLNNKDVIEVKFNVEVTHRIT